MEDEFQEADILFVDQSDAERRAAVPPPRRKPRRKRRHKKSAPIDVQLSLRCRHDGDDDDDTDGDGSSWEVTMPPHVLVGRIRVEEKLACSVCTGHGRTLKGRDLLYVRTSVLRMTGFYER